MSLVSCCVVVVVDETRNTYAVYVSQTKKKTSFGESVFRTWCVDCAYIETTTLHMYMYTSLVSTYSSSSFSKQDDDNENDDGGGGNDTP